MHHERISTALSEPAYKESGQSWHELLPLLANVALQAAQTAGDAPTGSRNAKGHIVKAFDISADEAVRNYLEQVDINGLLETEEGEPWTFGYLMKRVTIRA